MHTLLLGYSTDDIRKVGKAFNTIEQQSAEIKMNCSVMNPSYYLSSNKNIYDYNYLIDVTTGYHYFITDIIQNNSNTFTVECAIDTLDTYADKIKSLTALVSRSETKYSPYIVDNRIVPSVNRIINTVNVGTVGDSYKYTLTVNGGVS